jgi:thymidylate synthase (FAD)
VKQFKEKMPMEFIKPYAIHLAQTETDDKGLATYLAAVGAPDWATDASTGAEKVIEVLGRACYRSFAPGLNANVTKVRTGNKAYIENITKVAHGSLFEHAYDTYALFNVSRIVTHQQVRHRVGIGYAQESGHYVRVEGIKSWFPKYFEEHPRRAELFELYKTTCEDLEEKQRKMADILGVDALPMAEKKRATTAMRRLVPDGIATMLGVTANHRTWRWIISRRTSRDNDEEIRIIMYDVFRQQAARYVNLYADASVAIVEGLEEVTFASEKI